MSVNFDSTFGFDPAVQDSSMAARGLYATMVTWCDHQIYTRPDSFDGTFDLKRVRSVGGTVRLVRELVENGLFEEAGEGVYRVVTRRGLAVFGSFKNQKKPLTPEEAAELHEKKVVAGHAGGKASGESRRAKAEANRKQNEADAKQTASTSTKQTGSTTVPNQTKTMPSSSPDPSGPGSKQTASVAEAEARALADPFATAWNAYPRHTGSRREAEKAWAAAVAGHDGTSAVTEARLIGAVIAYAKTVDDPRYAPNMSRWLRQGAYMDTMPQPAETIPARTARRHRHRRPVDHRPHPGPRARRHLHRRDESRLLGQRQNRHRPGTKSQGNHQRMPTKGQPMSSKPTAETRRTVQRRDRYRCAMCDRETGSHWSGDSIHHREPRSHPFDRLHQPENLLQLCGSGTTGCHGWVHAHPARAYRLGYLVHTGKDPATIPVYYRTGGWQQLNADGTRHPCPPPENMPTHIDIKKGNE